MINENHVKAFKVILEKAVNIDRERDNITVVYDEFFLKYFDSFCAVVNEWHLRVTYIFIPDSYQRVLQDNKQFYLSDEIQLPVGVNTAVNESDIVLNFLTGSSKSSKVRGAVLHSIKDNGCKVIHCPKISDGILDVVLRSSFEDVMKKCELVAWALGNAETATIITRDPSGQELQLQFKLEGWNNDPFISSGVIQANSWGNIPPGEAFCCPRYSTVNGSICINGSVPGLLFKVDDYLQLTFSKGKILEWSCNEDSDIANYMNNLEQNAKSLNDHSWNIFAELGIGLNPAIKSLTGNPLFDEKMAGSIHIAIGDNVVFGHNVQSHIHEDMTILKATLVLDDKIIIEDGKLNEDQIETWRQTFYPPGIQLTERSVVNFKPAKIHFCSEGIKRKLNRGKRIGFIDVFYGRLGNIDDEFARLLKDELSSWSFEDLQRKTKNKIKSRELKTILDLLVHYKMATIKQ